MMYMYSVAGLKRKFKEYCEHIGCDGQCSDDCYQCTVPEVIRWLELDDKRQEKIFKAERNE